jgi:hypothetical protein
VAIKHTRPFSFAALEESAWFWALGEAVQALALLPNDSWPAREALSALHARAALTAGVPPLTFAPHVKRRRARRGPPVALESLYDGAIALRNAVPTREADWHDLFNALVFTSFPRSKHALHARQFEQQRERIGVTDRKLSNARTREQDTLTLLDEGGCIVAGQGALLAELAACSFAELPSALDAGVTRGALAIAPFGHALFEHVVARYTCPSAFAVFVEAPELPLDRGALVAAVDAAFANVLKTKQRLQSPAELRRLDLATLLHWPHGPQATG